MTARKMNSIRLTIVVSCLAALLGICLPKFFLPVAGAEATLLSASPSSPQSEDIEELLQQLEAVKEQLDSSGPTDELMELYQKLLDQINDLTDQGMGLQRRMDKSKEITDDSSGSGSVSNKKKKRKARDNSDDSFQIFSGPSSLCISGSLAAGDPTYNRVRTQTTGSGVQSPCSLLPSANNVRYDAYEFEITDCTTFPTNVTITLCGPAGCAAPQALDTVLYVYRTGGLSGAGGAAHPFNPGDPCNNVVAAEDDLTGVSVGPGGASGGVPACPTSGALSGLKRSLGSGKFVVVVTGFGNTTAGNYNLYIDAPDGGCTITQVAGCPVISISPSSIPPGTINTGYGPITFTATGGVGPHTFSQTGALPTGMSFVGDTLSGTPTQAGGFPIIVTATDANGCSGSQAYSLVITNPALPCITDGLFTGGPTFNRPNVITTGTGVSAPCTLSPTGTAVFYKAYEFTISGCTTGTLTATLCGPPSCPPITNSTSIPDSLIYLYRVGGLTGPGGTPGAFNPLLPCVNLVAANDDLTGAAVGVGGSSGGLTACSAKTSLSGLQRTIGTGSFVLVVASFTNGQTGAYNLSVNITGCTVSPQCSLTCPANVTTGNDANQCGSIVVYSAPTTNGSCGTVTCNPPSGSFFPVGTTTVTCTATAGPTCSFTVTVNDTQPPAITCPANVTTSTDPNQCSAVVTYSNATAVDNCPGVGTPSCAPPSGSAFPKGTTTVTCTVSDASGNSASCTFTVTVNDNQPPTITCPSNIVTNTAPGQCAQVVTFSASASDNCPGVTSSCSPPSGSTFPKGTTQVTCTATDTSGNTASCTFNVTVNDNENPTITCPANISTTAGVGVCYAVVSYTASASDNCPGVTVSCTPPSGSQFSIGTTSVACTATDASGNTNSCGFTVTVTNPDPVVTITGPPSGSVYGVGENINFTGTFTDAGGGTHTAVWTFTSANPTINQPGVVVEGTGAVSLTYSFSAAGVYFVKLTVNDSCGGSGFSTTVDGLDAMVVIFDSESFVTGGGWINSPAGAFIANASLTGKANFGFNAKYHNGSSTPSGQTEFKFKEGDINFHSTSYDWLVVVGARAQYQGSGTINGSGNYGFMVTVIDGQAPGGGGVDRFRIKIWDKNNGNAVVYDTQPGDPDSANPTLSLGGGSIVIH